MSKLVWKLPTTRTDDSPATAADVAHVQIFDTPDGGTKSSIATLDGPATSFPLDGLPQAVHSFTLVAIDTFGTPSAESSPVSWSNVVAPPPPAPLSPITDVAIED